MSLMLHETLLGPTEVCDPFTLGSDIEYSPALGMWVVPVTGLGANKQKIQYSYDLRCWKTIELTTQGNFNQIVWGDGRFVLVGTDAALSGAGFIAGGSIWTSTDGINWTKSSPNTQPSYWSVDYNPTGDIWVAAGYNGSTASADAKKISSTDGVNWTVNTAAGPYTGFATKYGASQSRWIMVGSAPVPSKVQTSTNGTTWANVASATILATDSFYDVAFGNNLWVIVGMGGRILTSPNGTTWTARTSGVTTNFPACNFGNGLFIVNGATGVFHTSTDGITWTQRSLPVATRNLGNTHYSPELGIWASAHGWTSTDGINWTSFI